MCPDLLNSMLVENKANNDLYKDFLQRKSSTAVQNNTQTSVQTDTQINIQPPQDELILQKDDPLSSENKTFKERYKENKKQVDIWQKELDKKGTVKDDWTGLIAAGSTFFVVKRYLGGIISSPVHGMLRKTRHNIANGEDIIKKMMDDNPNLRKNGFEYVFVSGKKDIESKRKILKKVLKAYDKSKLKKFHKSLKLDKSFKRNITKQLSNAIDIVAKGRNAFYINLGNVAVAKQKNVAYMLHEVGHAINSNKFKGASTLINISRALPVYALFLTALVPFLRSQIDFQEMFKKSYLKGVNDNPNLSKDKKEELKNNYLGITNITTGLLKKEKQVCDFVKNNIAPIMLLTWMPTIVEEALASKRALSYAKKFVNPSEMGKLKKQYGLALSTYVIAAGVSAYVAKYAVNIWNKVKRPDVQPQNKPNK